MHITVFGSTGKTGRLLVSQALEGGHTVIAAARSPEKMDTEHPNLSVVRCDVMAPDSLPAALSGADAVVICISGNSMGDTQTRSVGTANIVAAMSAAGVERVLAISTAGVGDSMKQLNLIAKFFVNTVIRKAVADHTRQEEALRSSGLRWTVARPGGLTDGPRTDSYKADPDGKISIRSISRADVADFLLRAAGDESTINKAYALSN